MSKITDEHIKKLDDYVKDLSYQEKNHLIRALLQELSDVDENEAPRFSLEFSYPSDLLHLFRSQDGARALYEFVTWLRGIWKHSDEDTLEVDTVWEKVWDCCNDENYDPYSF